jgi:protein gp37
MAGKSNIEWTGHSWNPLAGCTVLTPGCTNCYAMKLAARLERMGTPLYQGLTKQTKGGAVWNGIMRQADRETLLAPLRRKKPTTYFVNSMSDLFHENVPDEWIDQVFAVMALCPQHTFQVLTKRAQRMRDYFLPIGCINCGDGQMDGRCCDEPYVLDGDGSFRDALIEGATQKLYAELHPGDDPSMWLAVHMPLPNVWLGVSTERQQEANERIPFLLETPAAIRFISAEPLLAPIDLDAVPFKVSPGYFGSPLGWHHRPYGDENTPYPKLSWAIIGGESGHGYRDMDHDWAANLIHQCRVANVPVFMKQMAGKKPIPPELSIRQFPNNHKERP